MQTKLKVKLGFEQAKFTQGYQILVSIASAMFGTKKAKAPDTFAEAEAQFGAIFGKRV